MVRLPNKVSRFPGVEDWTPESPGPFLRWRTGPLKALEPFSERQLPNNPGR